MIRTLLIVTLIASFFVSPINGFAKEAIELTYAERLEQRMSLFQKFETVTNVPWYYLAAADSFERGLRRLKRLA